MTTTLKNGAAAFADVRYTCKLGFGGKMCVHPDQVPHMHRVILPSDQDLVWARDVLELGGNGVAVAAGMMANEPIRLRVR